MQLPPLQPINNSKSFISGDVTIDPSAAVASGVVITADGNSRIIIGAGVCIGMGSILQVGDGILEIETGAVLGAGVLVIGECRIGASACIGSATTVFNSWVEPGRQVPPGSILGDKSRRLSVSSTAEATVQSAIAPARKNPTMPVIKILPPTSKVKETPVPDRHESVSTTNQTDRSNYQEPPPPPNNPPVSTPNSVESSQFNPAQAIYGQAHLNRLMVTLFPHKNSLQRPIQDDKAK